MTTHKKTAPEVSLGEPEDESQLAATFRDDDYVSRVEEDEREDDGWDGVYTPVTLAFGPVMRDGYAVMPGDRCIGHLPLNTKDITVTPRIPCPLLDRDGKPTRAHQFHMATSKGPDGKFRGPEAANLRELVGSIRVDKALRKDGSEEVVRTYIKGGFIAGSRVGDARRIETARVSAERQPDPAANPPTKEQIKEAFRAANALMDNPVESLLRERNEVKSETEKLKEALQADRKELAKEMAVAVAVALKQMQEADGASASA